MGQRTLRPGPGVTILFVAPFFGESLSTATPPLDLLLPWNLAIMVAMYGSGALLCREIARRWSLGVVGLCLLAAAYAVYEEALVDRFWFDRSYAEESGVDDYGRVWDASLLLATHLSAFHIAISICASIVVVERLYPDHRERAWAGKPALVVAAVALLLVFPLLWESFPTPPASRLVAAAGLAVLLVGLALLPWARRSVGRTQPRSRRGTAWIAFGCTASHFVLVYSVPAFGIPWPLGLAVALAPIGLGVLLLRRSTDGLRIVSGMVAFFALLDVVIGLGGRYDLTIWGLGVAAVLWRLRRRAPDGVPAAPAT